MLNLLNACQAAYLAWESPEGQTNPNIRNAINKGLENVCILDDRSPRDVLYYLKQMANSLNQVGSVTSFVEKLVLIDEIEAGWRQDRLAARRAKGSSGGDEDLDPDGVGKRSQAGIETAYMSYISSHYPESFASYKNFDETLRVKHRPRPVGACAQSGAFQFQPC